MKPEERQFDVALSFAGEDRDYVEAVANTLKKMGIRVFYDKYETISLWGRDLYDHLQEIYQKNSRYTVIFISKYYAEKLWTNHERRSAQARAFSSNQEYILPARFDDTDISGILPTIGYVNLEEYSPQEFAELIKKKVGPIPRFEFLPDDLDVIYKAIGVKTIEEQEEANLLARSFFNTLKLMTIEERQLLITAIDYSCPAGFPDNIHLNIEKLSRLLSFPIEKIIAIFSRLDCLGIVSRLYKNDKPKDRLCKEMNVIEIKYEPLLVDISVENATYIAIAFVECITEKLCPECREKAFERLDFSVLNSLTGYPDL